MPHEERTTSLAAPPKMLTTLEKPISLRPEQICNEPTTLRLKQHSSLLSSGGYTITTPNTTETLYSATGPSKKWHSTRTITSATDLPLYDLRCDARFRWTIALPGQADEDAVATFTRRKSPNGDTLVLRFEASETGEEVTLVVRGKTSLIRAGEECVSSKDASVYWGDRLVVQTNIVDGKTARVPFKANEWDVSVAGGFDGSLAAVIAVYLAIYMCEKPIMSKSEVVVNLIAPAGVAGFAGGAVGVSGGGGGGGDGGDGGGGGGGSC